MSPPKIDEPLRLGRGFASVYAIALALSLWVFHPWSTDDRYMAVLSVILFPFLGAIALYSLCLFAWAVVSDFRRQKRAFFVFGLALIGILVAYAVASWRDRPISAYATGLVAVLASTTLRYLSRRLPNQLPDPTSPSVTPPAGAGGAPSVAADH